MLLEGLECVKIEFKVVFLLLDLLWADRREIVKRKSLFTAFCDRAGGNKMRVGKISICEANFRDTHCTGFTYVATYGGVTTFGFHHQQDQDLFVQAQNETPNFWRFKTRGKENPLAGWRDLGGYVIAWLS